MERIDPTRCFKCKTALGWSFADELIEYDADGTRRCYVERMLDCAGCGEVYINSRLFPVDRPLREAMRDPEFVRRRTLIVGGGEVPSSTIAALAWGEQSKGRGPA